MANRPEPQDTRPGSSLRAYAELVRVPNLFTAMADVVMGFLFTHALFRSGDGWLLGVLMGSSCLLYAGGVVLNDLVDVEVDARERPRRPLPSGRISLTAARWIGWEFLLFGVALAWLAAALAQSARPGLVATLLVGSVVLYNRVLKRTWLGPAAMGACRLLNVLLGMSLAVGPWNQGHWLVAGAIGTYIAGVTWFARTEAKPSSRWSLALATLVLLGGIGLLALVPGRIDGVVPLLREEPERWTLLMSVLALLVGFRCARAVVEPVPKRVQMAVKQCILSLVILDAAACFVVRGIEGAVWVLLLLIPTVILGRWIAST